MVETAQYIQPKDYSREIEVLTQWFRNTSNITKFRKFLIKNYRINHRRDFDDIYQETYLRAFKWISRNGLPDTSPHLNRWVYTIAINEVIDECRGIKRKQRYGHTTSLDSEEVGYDIVDTAELPLESKLDLKSLLKATLNAIVELPLNHKNCISLSVFDGLSYKEIADICGVSEGTVMSRIYYARQKIVRALNSEYNLEDILGIKNGKQDKQERNYHIISVYEATNGNAASAAKILRISKSTVRKIWKKNGLNLRGHSSIKYHKPYIALSIVPKE